MTLDLKTIVLENEKAYCIDDGKNWRCFEITTSHYAERKATIGKTCRTLEQVRDEVFIPRWGNPSITDMTVGKQVLN